MNQNATSYFRHLLESLLGMQVTDGRGEALPLDQGVSMAVELILSVKAGGGKAMVIGNGGSAAIASHLQNDLCNAVGIRALAFQEPPRLTAISNDRGYGGVFEEPVELWASDGDLLIAISSSGQSANILRAVKAAQARGCHIITLSGFSAHNPLRSLGNVNLYVASQEYGYVEAAHSVLAHFLTDCAMMAHPRDEA